MLSLRIAHERARADASFVEPDPRREMAQLAVEFPGALREIDRLPLEVIQARIGALTLAEAQPASTERWMTAQVLFHRYARGALAAKRWLNGRKTITATLRDELAQLGDEARLFEDSLHVVANPPRGRLMDVVYERVALALEITVKEARVLLPDAGDP